MWNRELALNHLNTHALAASIGRCAEYVRRAIEAGGIHLVRKTSAKDYGSSLQSVGFNCTTSAGANYSAGDVAVIQPIDGHLTGTWPCTTDKSGFPISGNTTVSTQALRIGASSRPSRSIGIRQLEPDQSCLDSSVGC